MCREWLFPPHTHVNWFTPPIIQHGSSSDSSSPQFTPQLSRSRALFRHFDHVLDGHRIRRAVLFLCTAADAQAKRGGGWDRPAGYSLAWRCRYRLLRCFWCLWCLYCPPRVEPRKGAKNCPCSYPAGRDSLKAELKLPLRGGTGLDWTGLINWTRRPACLVLPRTVKSHVYYLVCTNYRQVVLLPHAVPGHVSW